MRLVNYLVVWSVVTIYSATALIPRFRPRGGALTSVKLRDSSSLVGDPSSKMNVNALLKQCQQRNDYTQALELAEEMENDPKLNAFSATTAIRLYGEAKQLGKAIGVLAKLKSCGLGANEHHYGALIHAARRAGQWEMALVLFDRMVDEGIQPNVIIYNTLVSVLGDAQKLELVEEYLKRMDEEGIPKDTYTFSAAITACERSMEWQKALNLFDSMADQDVKANVVTLNAVLNACVKGRKWRVAMEKLAQAREMGIPPDAISYSSVITALGDAGRLDVALKLFDSMDEDGGRALLTAFAEKMSAMKPRPLLARKLVIDGVQAIRWGPVWKDTGAYNAIITACERNGEFQKALNHLHMMVKNYYNGNSNNAAVTNSKNNKKWGQRKFAKPDSKSFSAAIAACGNAGEWKKALGLFNLMSEMGVARDTVVYNTIIAALQNAGQFSQAKDLNDAYQSESNGSSGAGEKNGATIKVAIGKGVRGGPTTSEEMPQFAKDVYIQGLSEGMLKVFSGSGGDRGTGLAEASGPKEGGTVTAGLSPEDTEEILFWWQDVVNRELVPAGQRAIRTGSTVEMRDVLDKLNFESFKIGPNDSKSGGAGTYKEVDLHGFPLSVAKAAIDFLFSEIVDKARAVEVQTAAGGYKSSTGTDDDGDIANSGEAALTRVLEQACTFDLKIVTGRGKHTNSSGTRGVLREEIEVYIMRSIEPAGRLAITHVSGNDGVLVVSKASIKQWLRQKLQSELQ